MRYFYYNIILWLDNFSERSSTHSPSGILLKNMFWSYCSGFCGLCLVIKSLVVRGSRFSWIFGSTLRGFLPFSLANLTKSWSFWYGLKDLFTLYRLADKVVLDLSLKLTTSQVIEAILLFFSLLWIVGYNITDNYLFWIFIVNILFADMKVQYGRLAGLILCLVISWHLVHMTEK